MYIRLSLLILGSVLVFEGCKAPDPIDMIDREWERRKQLIIRTKGLYPNKGVPERVEWCLPKSIVIAGERFGLSEVNRRYNLVDDKGEIWKRIGICDYSQKSRSRLIDFTAWRYANSSSAPYDDEELIKHVQMYHDGEYIIIPLFPSVVEVLYSNVLIHVVCNEEEYEEDSELIDIAKAIIVAGIEEAKKQEGEMK